MLFEREFFRLSVQIKMKKKVFGILLLSIFLFFGCEKKVEEVETFQTDTLRIWVSEYPDFWEAVGLEFVSALEQLDLNIKVTSFENEEELRSVLLDRLAAGGGPDVALLDAQWVFENKEKFLPLEDDEALSSEKFKTTFVPVATSLLTTEETVWGLPITVDTLGIIYNEEHFINNIPDRDVPAETWEEFRDDIQTLTKKDNSFERFASSGTAMGRVDNLHYGFEILENILLQIVGNLFSPEGSEAVFATDQGVNEKGERIQFGLQATRFFLDFAREGSSFASWNGFLADSEEKEFETFAKGKVSTIFGFSRDVNLIRELIQKLESENEKAISLLNVRSAPLPQFTEQEKKIVGYVKAFAVPKFSNAKELSWKFLKFVMSQENMRAFAEKVSVPNARIDILIERLSDETMKPFVTQARQAQMPKYFLPRNVLQSKFETFIQSVYAGKVSVEKGLTELEKTFTRLLRRTKELSAEK